ncbi:MAG: hypothetical protein Kow0090_13070 [Myxococcota bacterium]
MKGTNVKIRRAVMEDVPALVKMQEILFKRLNELSRNITLTLAADARPFLEAHFESRLESQSELILIAEADGRTAGMACGVINYTPELLPNMTGYIRDVWVYPEFRRRKIATKMHNELIKFFKSRNVMRFTLSYIIGNDPAAKLWEGLGYKPFLITAERHGKE